MSTPVAPVLGQVLSIARKAKGLAQDAVADAVGVRQPTVSAWENGHLRPSLEQLVTLRRLLGADRGALWDAVEAELADSLPDELPAKEKVTADA